MPNRIIREGILTSDAVNALNWREEVFYRRLLSVVDDWGRYDGRPAVLRSAMYMLKIDQMSNQDVQDCLQATEKAGLVKVYVVDGKQYVEVKNFRQRVRTESKWPEPDGHVSDMCLTNDGQMTVRCRPKAKTESETKTLSVSRGVEQFPRSVEEVRLFMAAQLMKPKGEELKRCAASFFDDFSARGWRDSKGVLLANWQPAARKYARSWAANNVQQGRQGSAARKDANAGRRYE